MAYYTKRTEMTAEYKANEVITVSVNTSTYSNTISLQTNNDETLYIKFANKADLKATIELLMHAALGVKWSEDYYNVSLYVGDREVPTLETIHEWKQAAIDVV